MQSGKATILVAGGAGFIGSHFIRQMLAKRPSARVINFDKLTYAGNPENVSDVAEDSRYTFVKGDIADEGEVASVFEKYNPDYVIDFAAESHVDRSIHGGSADFIRTNVIGVHTLLEAARRSGGVKKMVQVSTDEVYGDLPLESKEYFHEETTLKPNSPYAATKAAGDLLCRAYFRTFGVPVVVTRCGNNYGPYQYPEKIIPFFILRTLENKTLPLYGDGRHVRDWIYVQDHCRALEQCLFEGRPGQIYNIGAGSEKGNQEIAEMILSHFGKDHSWIEFVTDRPGHDRRYALDTIKISRELGWRAEVSFEKGFRETIDWYLKNGEWIAKVRQRAGPINPHIA